MCNCDKKSFDGFNIFDEVNYWVVENALNILENIKKDSNVKQMVVKFVLLKIINNIEQFSKEEIDEFSTGSKNMLYQKVKSIIDDSERITGYKFKFKVDNKQVYPEIVLQAKGDQNSECVSACVYKYGRRGTTYNWCVEEKCGL